MKRLIDWFLCRDLRPEPIASDTPIADALLAEPRFRDLAPILRAEVSA